ncbi:MAG: hypothetical protein CM15mP103_02820 [Gammaproteobacteria bacterium]|nr:MAG: hypothetical protein CM15mP103_02820 [Gammaproteobacteria bacterium]
MQRLSAMEMRPLFEHYRDKRPVMAPDLPGFGLSDRPDVLYSSNMYCAGWLSGLAVSMRPQTSLRCR